MLHANLRNSAHRLLLVLAGCVSGHSAQLTEAEMSVQLPPFIVESAIGPTWRYMEIPRFEILSRCNDLTTGQLALAFHRAHQLLGLVLPARFQLTFDAPQTLIFYDEKHWPVAEQQAVATLLRAGRAQDAPDPDASPRVRLEPIANIQIPVRNHAGKTALSSAFSSNLMLTDADTIVTFALVSETTIDPQRSYLTPAYVGNLLQNRSPALPDWFTAGFLRLYQRMEFGENTITVKPLHWDVIASPNDREEEIATAGEAARRPAPRLTARRALELGQQPLSLPQAEQGDQFRRDVVSAKPKQLEPNPELLLPLAEFVRDAPPVSDLEPWLVQAELLVAWGLDPANDRADVFWNWLDRVSKEPVTEALFQKCLGMDYAAATHSISAYALKPRGIRWMLPDALSRPPPFSPEDASPSQIARIKGEWERLEVRYVRKNHSTLQEHYVDLARRTLRKPYDRGDRDPRLLASRGLLELEEGDQTAAQALLEAAVAGGVVRPRVYYELARLRYDHLFGRSTRNDGKFTPEQVASVTEPLLAGMKQSPRLDVAYELLAHISSQSTEPPSDEVLAALDEGARLFPEKRARLTELAILPP